MPARQLPPHLIDALEMCFGEVQYPVRGGFMASGFGRWLVLKLPIPRGRITAPPEFHRTQAGDFAADVTRASDLLERFSAGPDQAWGCSPIFGARSPQQWTRLQWAHTNHHLKQFGC
ncbi:MAG: DUF1569 domain-containing protein [Planctomycetota bacterium]|nr:DUF1569 domain-containing protein [Planctomycetota bacterium]